MSLFVKSIITCSVTKANDMYSHDSLSDKTVIKEVSYLRGSSQNINYSSQYSLSFWVPLKAILCYMYVFETFQVNYRESFVLKGKFNYFMFFFSLVDFLIDLLACEWLCIRLILEDFFSPFLLFQSLCKLMVTFSFGECLLIFIVSWLFFFFSNRLNIILL